MSKDQFGLCTVCQRNSQISGQLSKEHLQTTILNNKLLDGIDGHVTDMTDNFSSLFSQASFEF